MVLATTATGTNPTAWKEAIIDAALVFGYVFLASLGVFGFPPNIESVYISGLSSGIAFIASLSAWRRIKLPQTMLKEELRVPEEL